MSEHCDPMCPFLSCPRCKWQGGDTRPRQGVAPGLTCDNGSADEATPGGAGNTNRGSDHRHISELVTRR